MAHRSKVSPAVAKYKEWVQRNHGQASGTASSYVNAIEWLSSVYRKHKKINCESLLEVTDIDLLRGLYDEAKTIQKSSTSYIFNQKAPSYGERGFYSAAIKSYIDYLSDTGRIVSAIPSLNGLDFYGATQRIGLLYSHSLIDRFTASLLSKRFLILTGLSGSGKTKLAQAFAMWICESEDQYKLVPVGADWTNREPLLGYRSALNDQQYVRPETGILDLIIRANKDSSRPYFLILDEMNLSHVERYFADFLSTMESNESILLHSSETDIQGVPPKLFIPENLFIIGTVNIDETTYMFSPKVLDRANVIEFRVGLADMRDYLGNSTVLDLSDLAAKGSGQAADFLDVAMNKEAQPNNIDVINGRLLGFFEQLQKVGAEFGYRSARDINRLAGHLSAISSSINTAAIVDIAVMQKLLPKLHGSRRRLTPVLLALANLCIDVDKNDEADVRKALEHPDYEQACASLKIIHPLSFEKIWRMYRNAVENGYASYAEA